MSTILDSEEDDLFEGLFRYLLNRLWKLVVNEMIQGILLKEKTRSKVASEVFEDKIIVKTGGQR